MGQNEQDLGQSSSSASGGHSASSPTQASQTSANAELAQALRDLARGEQAASALEANLATLEGKLDELLAAFEGRTNSEENSKESTSDAQSRPGMEAGEDDEQKKTGA